MRFANIIELFKKQIKALTISFLKDPNDNRFKSSFICELLRFTSEVIGNYEVAEGEDKYREELNVLVENTIQLI